MAELSPRRLFRRRPTEPALSPEPVAEVYPPAINPAQLPNGEVPAVQVPGRSAGPRGERTVTVAVRLSPAEHARWVAAAAAGGRSQMGRWVRETVTARLDGRPVAAPVSGDAAEQLAGLRGELSRVGSNLNQLARALNVEARGGPVGARRDEAVQVVAATRAELGRLRDVLHGISR